jgi:hypothetical protein
MTMGRMRSIVAIGSLAAALTACDQKATMPTSLSTAPIPIFVAGTASPPPAISITTPFALSCNPTNGPATTVDLVITVTNFIDVEEVTFRININAGTHVTGSPITIPKSELNAMFGSTRVQSGTTRVFGFQPQVVCRLLPTTSFAADVVFFDSTGTRRIVTVSSSPGAR